MPALPHDFGPLYAETNMAGFPVEPWNTFSNLIFLLVFIYFGSHTRFRYREYPLLVASLPILLLGFIGGTLYHATRSHNIWLILDFGPILALTIMCGIFYWSHVLNGFIRAIIVTVLLFFAFRFLRELLPLERHLRISLGYSTVAIGVLLPCVIFSMQHAFTGMRYLLFGLLFFAAAVLCRSIDKNGLLPMGTHFLWHLFGGVATFCIFKFVQITAPISNKLKTPVKLG